MTENKMPGDNVTDSAPIVLAIDTSTPRLGLALLRAETVLASLSSLPLDGPAPHSRTLFDHLANLFRLAGTDVGLIDLLAVATGPGSFTGLRVGLAAMKGLAASLHRPLYGLDLFGVEAAATRLALPVLVLIEAGRDQVFCGLRQVAPDGSVSILGVDRYGSPEAALRPVLAAADLSVTTPLLVTGNAALRCLDQIRALATDLDIESSLVEAWNPSSPGWQIRPSLSDAPVHLALAALRLARNHQPALSTPLYIRPSDAELNLQQ